MSRRPDRVELENESDYRKHFEASYCQGPIETFDGIFVRFKKPDFDHAFFESVVTNDDAFSRRRAERIDWIRWALQNPGAELFNGWINKKKRVAKRRRVAIVNGDYVVIIRITGPANAVFVTAFVADNVTVGKIRLNGRWTKKYR